MPLKLKNGLFHCTLYTVHPFAFEHREMFSGQILPALKIVRTLGKWMYTKTMSGKSSFFKIKRHDVFGIWFGGNRFTLRNSIVVE